MWLRGAWKTYVGAFTVYRVHSLIAKAYAFPTLLQHGYLALGLVGVIPIVGFILNRRLFKRRFWQAWFFTMIAWALFDFVFYTHFFHLPSAPALSPLVVIVLAAGVAVPVHLAEFWYAFRSPSLWAKTSTGEIQPAAA